MFGSTPGGAFGASQPNPFGASSAPAFGQTSATGGGLFGARPFGAAASPFGAAQQTGGGLFGNATPAPSTPAFGATPAFGQTSSASAFGGTATFGSPQQQNPFGGGGAFGATQSAFGSSAFGASSAPAFGAASTPAFGAASAPAFGSTPAFGATQSAFGTNTFGATQPAQPAFGTFGQTAAAFGASTGSAFGATATPAFGASTSPFGQTSSAFGAASSTPTFGGGGFGAPGFGTPQKGTRWKRFEATPETDGSTTGVQGKFQSMTSMKEYAGKSFEELRWEDYQNNDKGGPAPAAAGGTMFGQQPATPSPFGGGMGGASPFAPATPSAFGAGSSPGGSIFGASTQASPFGQAASTSAFGTTSAPAFGSNAFGGGAAQPSPFGAPAGQQASVFGAQPTGSAFGTSSTNAFGGNAFGTPATQSTFGSTPFGSTSAFGAPSAAGSSIFGQNTGTFGGTGSAFGSGAAPSTTAFGSTLTGGAFGAPSTSSFGAPTSASIFGQTSTPSMFGGQTGGAFNFGGAQTKPAGLQLNMPSSSGSIFGNPPQQQQTSAPAFGTSFLNPASQPAQGSIFGGGGTFGTPQPSANPFNFAPQATGASPFSFAPQPQQQTAGVAQPMLQPSPVAAPYGTLPAMPQISITRTGGGSPAVQYGISTLPLADRAPPVVRTAGMLTPRHITPRSRIRLQARKVATRVSPGGKSSLFGEALEQSPNPRTDTLFGPRLDNPRTLFIREQTVDFSLTSGGDTPVKRLTNGETPQKQLTANGETPAKQSEAGSPSTPGARSTPGGPSDTPMSRGADTPAERTPHQNGRTPSPAKDKGKQPIREEEHEGPSGSGVANGARDSIDALLPKLRSEEYYTEPKAQELAAKERAERGYLRRVPGFTVGHKRFGSVRFLGETDVRRLDLESIILFHDKEVVVYPDEENKPEVGQGLNKPAEVSVLNVRRFDKKTGKAITEGPALDRFEKLLREKTAEQGATFLGWDREKGEWRFRVEHFSKYGLYLDDNDDEDDDMVTSADGKGDAMATSAEGNNSEKPPAEAEGSELTFGGAQGLRGEEHDQEEVFSREGPALAHSLPGHLGLDPVRMHQMRATLFAEDKEEAAHRQHAMRTPGLRAQFVPPGMLSPERAPTRAVADVNEGGELLAVWQRKRPLFGRAAAPSPARGAVPLAITGPESAPAKRARVTVGFREAEGTLVEHSRAGVDAGLFLGRSFRVGWGPGGVLAHSGGGSASVDGSQEENKPLSSQVQVESVALSAAPNPEDWFVAPLLIHRDRVIQAEGEGARRLSMQCDREQLSYLCQLYGQIAESQSESDGVAAEHWVVAQHDLSVWRLVDVLFSKQGRDGSGISGAEEDDDEDMEQEGGDAGPTRARGFEGLEAGAMEDEEVQEMERRAALSRWVRDNARSSADRDLEEIAKSADAGGKGKRPEGEEGGSPMKEVFAHLTAFRVEDAIGVAIATGDVRLATLIAQSGGSVEERADVACQVAAWQSLHVVDHIDEDRLRVYKLLGGDVDGALEGALPVDWKRYLGLLLWYGMPANATIPEIVSAYKARWSTEASSVPAPLPLYVEEGRRLGLPEPPTTVAAFDTSYYLLLLYGIASVDLASMQKMLRSASSTFDWLDHRLAWHLYSVLSAIGVPLPSSAEDLHMSFAAQLEAAGLCEWAVYVALHIEDDGLREQSVKELLGRHCEEWSRDEEKEALLMELNIPEEWMHEAQAQLSLANRDEFAALVHLLGSRQWGPAHHLFMTAVAPTLFVEGAHDTLIKYAEVLAAYSDEVADWSSGGGLYLDYYQMQEALKADGDDRPLDLAGLEQRTAACESVFTHIAKARVLWTGGSADRYLRLVYARMADDLSRLLRIDTDRSAPTEALAAAAYTTLLTTPVPQDARACRAHDAVAHFTNWLAEPIA